MRRFLTRIGVSVAAAGAVALDLTTEQIGDGNCQNMRDLPVDDGGQHYVQWEIPDEAYCLKDWA